ncbi:MAG: peptidase M64 [Ignavibacteriaceae bacterium]|nr:peptidase M64 [Ignavibacteriaceae bacterium]
MKKQDNLLLTFIFLIFFTSGIAFPQIVFEEYFYPKTLRVDYIHSGSNENDNYHFKQMTEEPFWGGSKKNLIDTFEYGKYQVQLLSKNDNKLIYSRNYSTLFSEWQTTAEAKKINKAFEETVAVPFPKNEAILKIYTRDKKHNLILKFEMAINPKSIYIRKNSFSSFPVTRIAGEADASKSVDIAILAEGYTAAQMERFREDCRKFAGYLFNSKPYKENKDKFNIYAIESVCPDSGTDIPGNGVWVNTAFNSSFFSLGLDRYLMTESYWKVRDAAANVPYDQIYILVNTDRYGGGAIFNYYNVCVNRNPHEEYVFVHEFGHGFSFLADEYYDSETTYEEFYDINLEPLEPNLSTLVDFDRKWKNLVSPGTPIPTPVKDEYIGKVGAFEGGGYVKEKVYRPRYDCSMNSISVDNYCPVCVEAITKMIEFYSD